MSPLDQTGWLNAVLGSYWTSLHASEDARVLSQRRALLEKQTEQLRDEAVRCVGRDDTPLWGRQLWRPLRVYRLDGQSLQQEITRYGDAGKRYGASLVYGLPQWVDEYIVDLPPDVVAAESAHATISVAGTTWLADADFTIDTTRHQLRLQHDPFSPAYQFPLSTLYEDGQAVGEQTVIWLKNVDVVKNYVHNHHGFLAGVAPGQGLPHREAVNAVWDAAVRGSADIDARRILAAVAGITVPLEAGQVSRVEVTGSKLEIDVTPAASSQPQTHSFPLNSTPVVTEGDDVLAGDFLVDTIRLYRPGVVPPNSVLPTLAIPSDWLSSEIAGYLSFANETVATNVFTLGGKTKFQFPIVSEISGQDAAFWQLLHDNGVAAGRTLARALTPWNPSGDPENEPISEPTAADLPTTINPAQFVCENVLRNHAAIALLKRGAFGDDRIAESQISLLRRVLPPHTAILPVFV